VAVYGTPIVPPVKDWVEITSGVAVTVKVVLPVTPLSVAEIVVPPGFSAEANPRVLVVATVGLEEAHRTCPVRFKVELLE
jgi:hypothetical protein